MEEMSNSINSRDMQILKSLNLTAGHSKQGSLFVQAYSERGGGGCNWDGLG